MYVISFDLVFTDKIKNKKGKKNNGYFIVFFQILADNKYLQGYQDIQLKLF